jgi:exodeoxyribonuclease VII large subunit
MPNTYLTVPFKDKDAAKALGARWDAAQRQWFVPDGRDLTAFSVWMPPACELALATPNGSRELAPLNVAGSDLALSTRKGMSLSDLLAGVSQAVAQIYRTGVWTLVEVVELRTSGGHVFLGVSERDANGTVLAKTSAVIWQSNANSILPAFEQATGAQLAPGIKLLVRARPVFKPLHGFSLEIDAIDSEYTLGDLEARKREIRERLQAEGVFGSNRQLPAPWDYNAVLVIAPQGGAGLGDFQAEADRLQRHGVCQFTYGLSRFQGEGAARELADALQLALSDWSALHATRPDAIVIIRGGGAVNDLAWLNDYDLARLICDSPIPVFTGIGHERDNTVLDEVAHTRFDTPSKVIAGIEHMVVQRIREAGANFEQLMVQATYDSQFMKSKIVELDSTVRAEARRHLARSVEVDTWMRSVLDHLRRDIGQTIGMVDDALNAIANLAESHVRHGALRSEALMREITGQGPDKTLRRGFALVRNRAGKPIARASETHCAVAIEIEFHDGKVVAVPSSPT